MYILYYTMSYISEQLLTTVLILDPRDLNNDIDNTIKHKLTETIEGKCHEDGFIVQDSIRIIKRSMGNIVTNNNKSEIKFTIRYKAKVISPSINDELSVVINNINKMGVLGYIKLSESDTSKDSPLIIMIPKEYFVDETIRNIDDLTIGQKIDVVVIGSRIKYRSENIQVIAKPV